MIYAAKKISQFLMANWVAEGGQDNHTTII
jgi:hypothetical protein